MNEFLIICTLDPSINNAPPLTAVLLLNSDSNIFTLSPVMKTAPPSKAPLPLKVELKISKSIFPLS